MKRKEKEPHQFWQFAVREYLDNVTESCYIIAKGDIELATSLKYWNDADFYTALQMVHNEAVKD